MGRYIIPKTPNKSNTTIIPGISGRRESPVSDKRE